MEAPPPKKNKKAPSPRTCSSEKPVPGASVSLASSHTKSRAASSYTYAVGGQLAHGGGVRFAGQHGEGEKQAEQEISHREDKQSGTR